MNKRPYTKHSLFPKKKRLKQQKRLLKKQTVKSSKSNLQRKFF